MRIDNFCFLLEVEGILSFDQERASLVVFEIVLVTTQHAFRIWIANELVGAPGSSDWLITCVKPKVTKLNSS